MDIRRPLAGLTILLTLAPSLAPATETELLLVSPQKAIMLVDGKRRVLSVGETSPEGLTLVAIESETAIVTLDGETRHLELARTMAGGPAPPVAAGTPNGQGEHRIYADNNGMYRATGSINGFPVNFIVDTGATTVVLNAGEARRLGIDYRMDSKIVSVTTASRQERGYLVQLRSVKMGSIEVRNVAATVIDGAFPPQALLGMSFLGRLESERTPTMLLLRKAY
jgi:aspartyl protease family protein